MAWTPEAPMGGTELKAAGLVAADTNHTAVRVGHGPLGVYLAWTAAEIASNDELYIVVLEANTLAETSTWTQIGVVGAFGATEVIGGIADTATSGALKSGFVNPYDYQVRISTYVNGTIATGLNFSASLIPIEALGYN